MAGEKFIQKAIKKPGALRKTLGIKKGETIPRDKLEAAANKPGKLGRRARLAITLRKLARKRKQKGSSSHNNPNHSFTAEAVMGKR